MARNHFRDQSGGASRVLPLIDGWSTPGGSNKASTGARPTNKRPLGTPGGINTDRLPSNPKAPDPDSRVSGKPGEVHSGLFSANCAWLGCAVIAHNLLRAAGTLAGGDAAVARGATLRRDLVNVPARFAAPARKPMLHLPSPLATGKSGWKTLWDNVIGYPTAQPRAA